LADVGRIVELAKVPRNSRNAGDPRLWGEAASAAEYFRVRARQL